MLLMFVINQDVEASENELINVSFCEAEST